MFKLVAVVIGVLALMIIGGILIFSVFDGGEKRQAEEIKKLEEFATTDTEVRMQIHGPIVANKEYREVWITVGRFAVTAEIIKGYEHTVASDVTYTNNENAYASFLAALEDQGFNKERKYSGRQNELGACPSGQRIIFDTFDGDEDIQHTWATSCSTKVGTFGGERGNVQSLFKAQVPDYSQFTQNVDL